MALETYYTFSADTLKHEIVDGKYGKLRHFMYGSMSNHFEALAPQWVTSWNSLSAGPQVGKLCHSVHFLNNDLGLQLTVILDRNSRPIRVCACVCVCACVHVCVYPCNA
jgi:hypothetical protein